MNFKAYQRSQSLLLPPSYETFLGESHEAVILAEFLDDLDLSPLEESYANDCGGRPAYHPAMLLSVLIYGYMNGVFSSREMAKYLTQDLAYMFLAAGETPDFRTLARFRKEKGVCLESVFTQVVEKARTLGFVSFGTVCLDGTKVRASASRDRNEALPELEQKITELIREAARVDRLEDEAYGDREDVQDPELKTKEGRSRRKRTLVAKRRRVEHRLQRCWSLPGRAGTSVNTTDPDSRLMKMKNGEFANGYNVQIMTENGLVLASHVAGTSADQTLLTPTVRTFEKLHGARPERLLADKGYSGEGNYRFCEEYGIDAFIPPHREPRDLTKYAHDRVRNTYTDPEGRCYHFKQHAHQREWRYIMYEHVDQRTKKKKYLNISHEWQRYAREQKEKLSSAVGRVIYSRRRHDVESTFGDIKHNMRFTSFRLRGLTGVSNEWNLIALAHNLKKMI